MGSGADSLLDDAIEALGLSGAVLVSAETRATDTRVWQVRHRHQLLAIRVLREDQKQVMEIEHRALLVAREAGIPAPEVIATGTINNTRPVMAIEWVEGEPVGDILLRLPHLARRLGTQAGAMLAKIHAIHQPSLPGSINWIRLGTHNDPGLEQFLNELTPESASLLHLDFHPFNLIARGGQLVGVLDWTNTAIGDPRADVARTLSIMQLTAPAFIGERGAHRMTIGLFTRAFLQEYQRHGGHLDQMAPFFAWAGYWMLADIDPKLSQIPVASPARLRRQIVTWTEEWRTQVIS